MDWVSDETMLFRPAAEENMAEKTIRIACAAMEEKGYNPINQLVGYQTVADNLSLMGLIVVVPMEHAQIAQVAPMDVGIVDIGLALHLLPDGIGDGLSRKTLRSILALHTERGAKPEQDGS